MNDQHSIILSIVRRCNIFKCICVRIIDINLLTVRYLCVSFIVRNYTRRRMLKIHTASCLKDTY